jgi:hypothetical protein
MWRIDTLLGNSRNTNESNNTGAVFSVDRARIVAMEHAQLTRARWRHTTIEEVMQAGVFCETAQKLCLLLWSVPSGYKRHRRSFESVELEAPAHQNMRLGAKKLNWGIEESVLLIADQFRLGGQPVKGRHSVWFAIQWYLEHNCYSSCVKIHCQEKGGENIAEE